MSDKIDRIAETADEPMLPGVEGPIDRAPSTWWKNRDYGQRVILEVPAGVDVQSVLPDDNPKTALGKLKPGTAAIPPVAILELGRAMTNGAVKYGRFNWRDKTITTSVYTDAIDRHLLAFRDGEDLASDSAAHHLAHVMACCAILLDAIHTGNLNDDRRRDGAAAIAIDRFTGS
ncbi:hypothetical protein GGQ64_005371 [Rhizobium azooxidifex]|uniref:dATP/dGTP diphosphohydrolase N-terminal domain-containing protein n=1 Tax=Mycoplana azooxidifex TaxID=1636188 RepID=A0A7W6DCL9_9HYPH|nr:dATP/dGTP diphosphohydrolase domain-containing protein [Mycoplana azooxidifex]MBB3980124.1 hypothetical protein [Mycoplana azooxidifex]